MLDDIWKWDKKEEDEGLLEQKRAAKGMLKEKFESIIYGGSDVETEI